MIKHTRLLICMVVGLSPFSLRGAGIHQPAEGVPSLFDLPGFEAVKAGPGTSNEIVRLWERGKKRAAFKRLKTWGKKEKKSAIPWVIGGIFHYQSGRFKSCLSWCKKGLGRNPQCAEAFFWKGKAFEALNKPLEAANEYRAALFAKQGFAKAQEGLDRVLAQLETKTE